MNRRDRKRFGRLHLAILAAMRLLIFSDIHSDATALAKLMETEADYYFAAGDLVNWARGFEKIGPVLQRRGDRMYVIPGNHESESDIARFCERYGFHNFHGQTMRAGGYTIGGLGYSNPTPVKTPGGYTQELVNWARCLEEIGPVLQRRGDRMYVIPGNHESESDIARFCERYGFHKIAR